VINKTALSIAKQIIKQEYDTESSANKETNEKILMQMIKIYSFKETNKKQYEK
jgi:hypothetical protein